MANFERDLNERARTTALTALEVVPFAMLIVDSSAYALAVNTRWMELSDLGRTNSMGPGWLSVLDPESRSLLQETLTRVGAEGGTGSVDLQINSGTKSKWVRWWASRHEVDDSVLIAVAAADIDADYSRQANLYHRATHDALTGLVNRSHFMECTEQALRRSARQQRHVAVVYVDLDDFKRVNDRGGHSLGDRVLYAIAARLRHAVRAADLVARIGGDEFAVLCEGLTASEQAEVVARRIASALTESVELDGQRWPVAASVGIAIDQGEIEPAEALVDRADQAMYSVKMAHRPSNLGGAAPLASRPERRRLSDTPIVEPVRTATPTPPLSASPEHHAVLDAEEARRALRELVDGGSGTAGPRSSAAPIPSPGSSQAGLGAHTAPSAATTTMAPPAPAPPVEGSRERLATDVLKLRDSIDSIRLMLDRLLGDELADRGIIDIREY